MTSPRSAKRCHFVTNTLRESHTSRPQSSPEKISLYQKDVSRTRS